MTPTIKGIDLVGNKFMSLASSLLYQGWKLRYDIETVEGESTQAWISCTLSRHIGHGHSEVWGKGESSSMRLALECAVVAALERSVHSDDG